MTKHMTTTDAIDLPHQNEPPRDETILDENGKILLFSCDRFVRDIVEDECCFVCGARPGSKIFNDEHIIPRWVLRRFGLFTKSITLPTGERRTYDRYKVPCCKDCNSLLGEMVETPISKLLDGNFADVVERIEMQGPELLFTWLSLLFFKIHLKDRSVAVHKNRNMGSEVIGALYDWPSFHHVHAVARSPYTKASLLPGVVGSLRIVEIDDDPNTDPFDYLNYSFEQTIAVRLGRLGIVAVLNDAGGAAHAWQHKLELITTPIATIQLKEVAAMLAVANDAIITRPQFGTMVYEKTMVMIFARLPGVLDLPDFVPEAFGHALLFALRELVKAGRLEIDGTRDPEVVAEKIKSGHVRFLTDEAGLLRRLTPLPPVVDAADETVR